MTTFRSGRLEAILGGRVDELTVDALDQLVAEHVAEDFDLEFKGALYRNNEKGKSDLATDVCALANAAGGVIFLGIEEDNQARAVAAPGVAVSDDEYTRMLKIVASNTAPMPDFTIRPISNRMRGFYVLAVPRSIRAPHAVVSSNSLRYPRRHGTTTIYLAEPEVAAAYNDRFAGRAQLFTRLTSAETEMVDDIDDGVLPWLVVSVVEELPGDLALGERTLQDFQRRVAGEYTTALVGPQPSQPFPRTYVGFRRLVAAGASPETVNIAKRAIHAHDDGTVVFAVQLSDLWEPERRVTGAHGQVKLLGEDQIASGILNGLFIAGRHAREVARASGGIFAQAQVKFGSSSLGWGYQIGHQRSGIVDASGATILRRNPPPSTTQADLDDLTLPDRPLVRAAARLLNGVFQAFGVAEARQYSEDGFVWRDGWSADWRLSVEQWVRLSGRDLFRRPIRRGDQ